MCRCVAVDLSDLVNDGIQNDLFILGISFIKPANNINNFDSLQLNTPIKFKGFPFN